MTKKYSPRSMPVITRESYSVERSPVMPSWMSDFAKSLEKTSVEPMRNEPTLYDQISSIMGGTSKSKYPTVAAAVEDMKKRTGLAQFLNQTVASDKVKKAGLDIEASKKFCDGCKKSDADCLCKAGCDCSIHCLLKKKSSNNQVKLFEKVPQIKTTIDNYLDSPGMSHMVLPAVLQHIKSIHSGDVVDESDWNEMAFLRYIKEKLIEEKKKHPDTDASNYSNLGKVQQVSDDDIDPSNMNALHSLMPATGK